MNLVNKEHVFEDVEAELGIEISQTARSFIDTKSALVDYVVALAPDGNGVNAEDALRAELGRLSGSSEPAPADAEIAPLLPGDQRLRSWEKLRTLLSVDRWPDLEAHSALESRHTLIIGVLVAVAFLITWFVSGRLVIALLVFALLSAYMAVFITNRRKEVVLVLEPEDLTIEQLALAVEERRAELIGLAPKAFARSRVEEIVDAAEARARASTRDYADDAGTASKK